jgi:hypothetical protein
MTGLQDYIEKHGNHFTVELAMEASKCLINKDGSKHLWDAEQVEKLTEKKVYYNITRSTLGDMVYIANMAYANYFPNVIDRKNKCIEAALAIVEDVDGYEGMAFSSWVTGLVYQGKDFDFSKYV